VIGKGIAALFVLAATALGVALDAGWGTAIDDWVHDPVLVYRARTKWQHVALVALDEDVPLQVGRKQALPLVARAAERLVHVGVKGIFLDVRLSKVMEVAMPYALCLEAPGVVRWSKPRCVADADRCRLTSSRAGISPLAMAGEVFPKFRVAPYLPGQEPLPDFLLYGLEALPFIPQSGLTASDRLVSRDPAVVRWMDLSPDHAVVQLASLVDPERTRKALVHSQDDESCGEVRCRRVRLSHPRYQIQPQAKLPIFPLSLLAACNEDDALKAAAGLKDKAVIFQLTSPAEATDMLVTPMTVALGGPHLFTPGAQLLADAVETLLLQDHPRAPPWVAKILLFVAVAAVSVFLGRGERQMLLLIGLPMLALGLGGLCLLSPFELWPVTATVAVYLCGILQTAGLHLVIGLREGRLIRRYMPRQIHDLLIAPGEIRFRKRCHQAIVLMSDLKGYTTVSQVLEDPASILELMNDYLEETSLILQEKYQGWLEAYVGDLVCYYWPLWEKDSLCAWHNALLGAVELMRLQRRFFAGLKERYAERFPQPVLERIAALIDAGIGMASGAVVMGDLGPRKGVRKFGVLGDPLNLAARLESLTRAFNCHLIVSEELAAKAGEVGLAKRRLGRIAVKGRTMPTAVFALGEGGEEHFSAENVRGWENWLAEFERGEEPITVCPSVYAKDLATLRRWRAQGWLKEGVFYLDEK
jgi:adenylate cyclase